MTRYIEYEKEVLQSLWSWSNQYHLDQLDGIERQRRPPVLTVEFAMESVLVPQNGSKVSDILAAIPQSQRHRWFRSLKSSQALTQSVFGAIRAFDRLDLLESVPADCGRPAFFDDHRGTTFDFEHDVRYLGEPRPTSIDVLLSGPQKRVAIECKFTEREFGTCSRPQLRSDDGQYCNGNYMVQHGRRERCSLTEIGVQYWKHLPQIFDWLADRDHVPCPFGHVYQLARNALAATVTPDGKLDPTTGHALVVYDARNPEFQCDGRAEKQIESVLAACRVPGLIRRLSWQRLIANLNGAPELGYLVENLGKKYGLMPD